MSARQYGVWLALGDRWGGIRRELYQHIEAGSSRFDAALAMIQRWGSGGVVFIDPKEAGASPDV